MLRFRRSRPHADTAAPVRVLALALALALALVCALLTAGGPAAHGATAGAGQRTNIAATHTGKCLEVATQDSGEPVRQRRCAGREGALWYLKASTVQSGAVHIVSALSGKCLAVEGSRPDAGAAVVQEDCGSGPGASFRFEDRGDAALIHPVAAGPATCLEVAGSAVTDGAPLRQWSCDGQPGAHFAQGSFPGLQEGWIKIRPAGAPHLCLTEGRGGVLNVPVAVQRPCAQAASPRTYLVPRGDGLFRLQWHSTQAGVRCLMVFPFSTVPDLLEPTNDCAGANVFLIEAVEAPVPNTYRIHTLHTPDRKVCVGITGRSTAEGATARQEPCADRVDQVFFIDADTASAR
ncbi:RICIN domain-containing protein [Streptomyces longispororuber]|uniref:RICIN domain-containing protein n=1 Tax=Streptomyces longispororuber TaxID=68230 RepID=UPI0033E05A3C